MEIRIGESLWKNERSGKGWPPKDYRISSCIIALNKSGPKGEFSKQV